MVSSIVLEAFKWGIISALSYNIGAVIGVLFNIPKKWNSAFLAYGGGALIFALTVELYGESTCEYHHSRSSEDNGSYNNDDNDNDDEDTSKMQEGMILLAFGSVVGAITFFVTNYLVEDRGGFMRKFSLQKEYIDRWRKKNFFRREEVVTDEDPIFTVTWADDDNDSYVAIDREAREGTNPLGAAAEEEEEEEDDAQPDAEPVVTSPFEGEGVDLGEQLPLTRTSQAGSTLGARTVVYPVPGSRHGSIRSVMSPRSHRATSHAGSEKAVPLPHHDANDGQVGIAIWIGLLIDALPESLVIGILAGEEGGVSITFIAGVFLSNLPEAMSSSIIMRRSGMKAWKILFMWLALTLITGIGAAIGALIFSVGDWSPQKELASKFLEGMAAGAMLVVVAETNLPEAFRFAGNLVGFATLFGFLSAYVVKLLEI